MFNSCLESDETFHDPWVRYGNSKGFFFSVSVFLSSMCDVAKRVWQDFSSLHVAVDLNANQEARWRTRLPFALPGTVSRPVAAPCLNYSTYTIELSGAAIQRTCEMIETNLLQEEIWVFNQWLIGIHMSQFYLSLSCYWRCYSKELKKTIQVMTDTNDD